MDWIQFTVFILGNMVFTLTLWLWNRSESRQDNRRCLDLIEAIKNDSHAFQTAMQNETKDFHGRLCAIEERNKK